MPEPDLVTLGDRTVVDCASIVAHLNTRGNFELAHITVEEECTLRTRSRIQQGVHMETGSMLLEKVRYSLFEFAVSTPIRHSCAPFSASHSPLNNNHSHSS